MNTSFQGEAGDADRGLPTAGRKRDRGVQGSAATLAELAKERFPNGLVYDVALDTTLFVQASIDEVIETFFEAVVLVVLVVFVFLHSLRQTIIPTLAVPVSILGALVGMLVFGFSINMLTLFGMILAIGLVVDDAIVVVENTERNMVQHGLTPSRPPSARWRRSPGRWSRGARAQRRVRARSPSSAASPARCHQQFAVDRDLGRVLRHHRADASPRRWPRLLLRGQVQRAEGFFRWFNVAFEAPDHEAANGTNW